MTSLTALLAAAPRHRMHAIRELAASDALRFALRRVLFTDAHAEVRAAAARRLAGFANVEAWLTDALGDASPLVRDAILRALARTGTPASAPPLRALIDADRMWWVRRGAIYALAAIAGEAELATFTRALEDPFWRVRHAAIKVLAVLGAANPELRDELLAAPPSSTLTFLRATWGPVAIEAPARATMASALPAELLDPDPAVVTARLAVGTFPALALVELLCDPHVPLRALAMTRIARSGDRAALEATLDWLEEPRVPHVVDTVHSLLDGLGDVAGPLAAHALGRVARPGGARWAIGWVVATSAETLYDAALARARHGDASLRRLALPIASDHELAAWVEPVLVDAIATELHARRRPAAHDTLLALDGVHHPRVRALQIDVLARRACWPTVEAGLFDPHHGPRAVAARWTVRHDETRAGDLVGDPDPAVREAALTPATAAHVLATELDPWTRRAAIGMLAQAWQGEREVPATVREATTTALGDPDPWIRAQACTLAITDDRALAAMLERLGDFDEMVRSAAHDASDHVDDADRRIAQLITALPPVARAAAHGWLGRRLDDGAAVAARAALVHEPDVGVRRVLAGIAGIELAAATAAPLAITTSEAVPAEAAPRTDITATPRIAALPIDAAPRPDLARRPFGRAGFSVAPLAISGAHDLAPRALAAAAEAGVDLFFWEPGYETLGQFLRGRPHARVITGSYHADAASIRADVDRALRRLRRDTLDAFLLFWTRSPARLDAATFAVLDKLRCAGKIRAVGFSTHHRDLARAAIETTPWDVVMIRHSAAHPGIETALLPTARETGTAIVTFSALTYGRMISGSEAPTAAECYRYSLSQPGVTACISAPRRTRELVENLGVLGEPTLAPDRLAALRAHGTHVHAESARFNTLVRQPTRDAAAAARELLAAELPPGDAESVPSPLPRAAEARRSRTRLGSKRRGTR